MEHEATSELLQQLLAACNEGSKGAIELAGRTDILPLRDFLHESAQQYRRAAEEILSVLQAEAPASLSDATMGAEGDPAHDDIAARWERTDCEALTYFRDAYDTPLPAVLADTVKRHLEAGVTRLERLRKLQRRLG